MTDSDGTAAAWAKYSLLEKMTPYLDRHLVVPILQFVQETGIYAPDDVTRAEVAVLSDTKMIDLMVEKRKSINEDDDSDETAERRKEIIRDMEESRPRFTDLFNILESEHDISRLRTLKSISEICSEFNLAPDIFDRAVEYAKLHYDTGNYSITKEVLKHYRSIMAQDPEKQPSNSSAWGYLASSILGGDYDDGADIIEEIDQHLSEAAKLTKREVLLQRTWLLHWSLFCLFKGPTPPSKLDGFLLNHINLSIISLSCGHLFRYVGACLILVKKLKREVLQDTVQILSNETATYSDPVTRFLLALYVDMDFDEAQRELKECKLVCKGDYFLADHWEDFEENARLLVFETYCRVHQCINIEMIATRLNMEAEEAELWIVKLIQNAKLDARIDSEKSRVVMSKAPPSVYQQVIERTKNLSFRSTMLLSNLEENASKDKAKRVT
jgi:translation initiation factor 3 subunit E